VWGISKAAEQKSNAVKADVEKKPDEKGADARKPEQKDDAAKQLNTSKEKANKPDETKKPEEKDDAAKKKVEEANKPKEEEAKRQKPKEKVAKQRKEMVGKATAKTVRQGSTENVGGADEEATHTTPSLLPKTTLPSPQTTLSTHPRPLALTWRSQQAQVSQLQLAEGGGRGGGREAGREGGRNFSSGIFDALGVKQSK
jgi:flagellar biosynthesis GTPase FlhF